VRGGPRTGVSAGAVCGTRGPDGGHYEARRLAPTRSSDVPLRGAICNELDAVRLSIAQGVTNRRSFLEGYSSNIHLPSRRLGGSVVSNCSPRNVIVVNRERAPFAAHLENVPRGPATGPWSCTTSISA
jgi:hypothetical protein